MSTTFESYFSKLKDKDETEKFVILLGSGFHNNDTCNVSVLNDWNLLLKSICPNFKSSGNYLLDFEKILLDQVSDSTAQKQENLFLKDISNKIKAAEQLILNSKIENYPAFIFNPNYVSDVISLNFDTVAEKLCRTLFKAKLKSRGYIIIDESLGVNAMIHQTTRYRILKFPNGKTIRFWYPHGSVVKPTKIILGARKYGQHLSCLERLRKHSKKRTNKNPNKDTWYDKLTHNPVLILGASISSNEWDLWSAIVNRERNFFKQKNIQYRNPIFQMRYHKSKVQPCGTTNQHWFNPLFDDSLCYEKQWNKLEELLKNKQ